MQAARPAPRIPEPRRNALEPSYAPRIAFQTDTRYPPKPYDTRNRTNSAPLAARNALDDKSICRDATRCPGGVFERIPNSAISRNKTPRWQEGNQNLANGEAAYIVPHVRMEPTKGNTHIGHQLPKKQTARTGRSDNPSGGLGRGRQSPPTLFAEITSCQLLSLSAPAPMYGDGQRLRGLSAPYAVTPKISDVAALKAIPQPLPLLLLPVGRIVWIRDKTHFVVHVETLFLPPQSAESGQLLVTLSNLLLVVGMFLPHLPHLCVPVLPHHRADNSKPLVSLHAATPFQSEGHSRPLAAHSAFWPPVP